MPTGGTICFDNDALDLLVEVLLCERQEPTCEEIDNQLVKVRPDIRASCNPSQETLKFEDVPRRLVAQLAA
eukprot:9051423-Pyramimonas_sp.AAC.1